MLNDSSLRNQNSISCKLTINETTIMGSFTGNNLRDQERSQNVLLFFIFTKRKIQDMHIQPKYLPKTFIISLVPTHGIFHTFKNLSINSAIIIITPKLFNKATVIYQIRRDIISFSKLLYQSLLKLNSEISHCRRSLVDLGLMLH